LVQDEADNIIKRLGWWRRHRVHIRERGPKDQSL
jgi:hypothetical protein